MKTRKSAGAAVTRSGTQAATAAASAMLLTLALAACAPSAPTATSPSPTPATSSPSSTPLPTPEPLIIPGCETLLPLSDAKRLFSPDTQALSAKDSVPPHGDGLPEFDVAGSNATIAKNCIWGLPQSDGGFNLIVTDITEADAEALSAALIASGFVGTTTGGLASLEFTSENMVGTVSDLHYFVDDLWIYVNATSADLATDVADRALDAVRVANPTRTY